MCNALTYINTLPLAVGNSITITCNSLVLADTDILMSTSQSPCKMKDNDIYIYILRK